MLQFLVACETGDLNTAQSLYQEHQRHHHENNLLSAWFFPVILAVRNNHLEMVQWMWDLNCCNDFFVYRMHWNYLKPTPEMCKFLAQKYEEKMGDDGEGEYAFWRRDIIDYACWIGDLQLVEWCVRHWGIILDNNVLASLIDRACHSGNMLLVHWLYGEMKGEKPDLMWCLPTACSSGNLELAKWVKAVCGFDCEVKSQIGLLCDACISKNIEVFDWVLGFVTLAKETFMPSCLSYAVETNALPFLSHVINVLEEKALMGDDEYKELGYAVQESGQLDIIQWFLAKRGISGFDDDISKHCRLRKVDTLKWLYDSGHMRDFSPDDIFKRTVIYGKIKLCDFVYRRGGVTADAVRQALHNCVLSIRFTRKAMKIVKWLCQLLETLGVPYDSVVAKAAFFDTDDF
jgi:hypothetical protein